MLPASCRPSKKAIRTPPNISCRYPGAVQITSGGNTLASGSLTDGVGTFSMTLTNTAKHHAPQQQTITVSDGTMTSSNVVTVN